MLGASFYVNTINGVNALQKFMVLDGNSLIYRAFHALPLLSTRQGTFTNAVLGFTNMLFKLLKAENPDYIAVAFDKGRTFRHEEYDQYKIHRKPMPDELRPQIGLIKKVLEAMNIPVFECEGYEADDVIGSLVKQAEDIGLNNLIVTGDRDALQLISDRTTVMLTRKGISEMEVYDPAKVEEKYGLQPSQLVEVKALMGDASDNIPGVPGVGEKTALKLIKQFDSLENLMDNLDNVTASKLAQKLDAYRAQSFVSRRLAVIQKDIDFPVSPKQCAYGAADYRALLDIFEELEFRRLTKEVLKEIKDADVPAVGVSRQAFRLIGAPDDIKEFGRRAAKVESAAVLPLFAKGPYREAEVTQVGIYWGEEPWVLDVPAVGTGTLGDMLKTMVTRKKTKLTFFDAKRTLSLFDHWGETVPVDFDDIRLAAYLLDPSASEYSLDEMAGEYLGETMIKPECPREWAALGSRVLFLLRRELLNRLEAVNLMDLYQDLELPLVSVMFKMENRGISIDRNRLHEMSQELAGEIEKVTQEIFSMADCEFNINSPQQLGDVLFKRLNLPAKKRTKTGFSTSAEVLEALAPHHEIVERILYYRQLVKLKSTYVDGLEKLVDAKTGKIHTTFNQTVTTTGRLSSAEPNLQNIPIRLEMGRRIRKVFVASSPERLLLAADYSQIELRVLAHLSGDEGLKQAFIDREDIHTRTASEVFGVKLEDVDRNMRRMAKAVNFGIVYGISDFGLARDLGISRAEAGKYIDRYFRRYPGVKKYMEGAVVEAREKGYVTTLLKRRRYLPDLFSRNRNIRMFGERTAMNTPIQGSAADIIKLAMLDVDSKLEDRDAGAEMLLQVHDELIFEVEARELNKAAQIVKDSMEGAFPLDVPLVVDVKYGPDWYDMRPLDWP